MTKQCDPKELARLAPPTPAIYQLTVGLEIIICYFEMCPGKMSKYFTLGAAHQDCFLVFISEGIREGEKQITHQNLGR